MRNQPIDKFTELAVLGKRCVYIRTYGAVTCRVERVTINRGKVRFGGIQFNIPTEKLKRL